MANGNGKKPLTEKQLRFIDLYIKYGNASRAAKEAGYSPKNVNRVANELLKKPRVKEAIDNRLEELQSERVADAQEVLEFYTSVLRGEESEQILRGVGEGEQTIDRMELGGGDRLKAADALAKRYGLFKDGEVTNNIGVTFIDDIDDEDEPDDTD